MFENLNNPQKIYLNFNANKVRWLSDSKIAPSDFFCLGSAENAVNFIYRYFFLNNSNIFALKQSVSVWKLNPNQEDFEPNILAINDNLDGFVTELKV